MLWVRQLHRDFCTRFCHILVVYTLGFSLDVDEETQETYFSSLNMKNFSLRKGKVSGHVDYDSASFRGVYSEF